MFSKFSAYIKNSNPQMNDSECKSAANCFHSIRFVKKIVKWPEQDKRHYISGLVPGPTLVSTCMQQEVSVHDCPRSE